MNRISIIGTGRMAQAIQTYFQQAGSPVTLVGRDVPEILGDIVLLAIPYQAAAGFAQAQQAKLAGKVVVDIANPVDFQTLDGVITPPGQSAAEILQQQLPRAAVLKAFNTTSAFILNSGQVGGRDLPSVLLAGDDAAAKRQFTQALAGAALSITDVGPLKRARELEALGFLQMALVKNQVIATTGGFSLLK